MSFVRTLDRVERALDRVLLPASPEGPAGGLPERARRVIQQHRRRWGRNVGVTGLVISEPTKGCPSLGPLRSPLDAALRSMLDEEVGSAATAVYWLEGWSSAEHPEVLVASAVTEEGLLPLVLGGPDPGTPYLALGQRRFLAPRSAVILGQAPRADVRLPERGVSAIHARVELAEARLWVEDLGSRNGTWVDSDRVRGPRCLRPGDVLVLGEWAGRVRVVAGEQP